jgi:hypothetical protein
MAHTCHAIGCTKPVQPRLLMCRTHWDLVPDDLQQAVWAAYRPGQERDKRPTEHYLIVSTRAAIAVAEAEGRTVPRTPLVALEVWERHEQDREVPV